MICGLRPVVTAGTAVQLAASEAWASWLCIQANTGNTGAHMMIGGPDVVETEAARKGVAIAKAIANDNHTLIICPGHKFNLQNIWVDSVEDGDLVNYSYIPAG